MTDMSYAAVTVESLSSNQNGSTAPIATQLRAQDVSMEFSQRKGLFRRGESKSVLRNINLTVSRGVIVGLVGNSGGGKTTLAKILAGLLKPTEGQVFLDEIPLYSSNGNGYSRARQAIRFMFQNVNAPLNPRMKLRSILEEPLLIHTKLPPIKRETRIEEVAAEVYMPLNLLDVFPRALSGGEKRRAALARALMCRPSFIIADEPTAGLDTDLREALLKLFRKLRDVENTGILLISHDRDAIAFACDNVVSLSEGRKA
jgi:ABC-type glutathione transport system ATPase component